MDIDNKNENELNTAIRKWNFIPGNVELENVIELEDIEESKFERDQYLVELSDRLCRGQSLQTSY